jgi:molybdenum cofactor guanylyltransferase
LYTKASTETYQKVLINLKSNVSQGLYMNRTAIILAGGFSSRFGQDKSLLELNSKPLIKHAVDAIKKIVDEIIIVTNEQNRIDNYAPLVGPNVKFALDIENSKGPLVGALTGLNQATGSYALIIPSDMPFVSSEIVELLFDLSLGKSAVIPRWPNTEIEPLLAVYHTQTALKAAKTAINAGKLKMADMLDHMQGVRYLSTLVVQELDPELKTFFNINTPIDLKKAETLIKPKPHKMKQK